MLPVFLNIEHNVLFLSKSTEVKLWFVRKHSYNYLIDLQPYVIRGDKANTIFIEAIR